MANSITLKTPLWFGGVLKAVNDQVDNLDYGYALSLVNRGEAAWVTPPAARAEDTFITKDQADAVFHAKADLVRVPLGSAASAVALAFGTTDAEGLQIKVIDETISFADNVALYKALTTAIPAGAVILSVQANIEAAVTGGGTTVKVGIGLNASDPDLYGLSTVLTKNAKINTVPDWAVLAGATTLDVCACATNGAAGNTALTVGSVRVRVVYLQTANLVNAA